MPAEVLAGDNRRLPQDAFRDHFAPFHTRFDKIARILSIAEEPQMQAVLAFLVLLKQEDHPGGPSHIQTEYRVPRDPRGAERWRSGRTR